MTNEVIVGEVEFYLADKSAVASATEQLISADEGAVFEQTKVVLEARFFGTDFNYANSKNFRKKFAKNTQDRELIDIGLLTD